MGMKWLPWDELPEKMRTEPVRAYYDRLAARWGQRAFKRAFDVAASMMLLTLLAPVWVVIAVMIRCDSKGPVMFRQARVTQYGRVFRIYKFRTMVDHAERLGHRSLQRAMRGLQGWAGCCAKPAWMSCRS